MSARLSINSLVVNVALWAAVPSCVDGRVVVVPDSATSIQQGLNELLDSDTLYIRQGWYLESVVAPPIQFVMIGETSIDTALEMRPLIDATFLSIEDTVPLLLFPEQSRVELSGIRFRNVARAGVVCRGQQIAVESCLFDSVNTGFKYARAGAGVTVEISDCEFRGNYEKCLQVFGGNTLVATGCRFTSAASVHVRPQVSAGNSRIDSCFFSSQIPTPLIYGFDGPHEITNCTFGPVQIALNQHAVQIVGGTVLLENNLFRECDFAFRAIDIQSSNPDSVIITGNRFVDCHGPDSGITAQGVISVTASGESLHGPVISGNIFEGCYSNNTVDDIFLVPFMQFQLEHNEFIHDSINGLPSVFAGNPAWQPTQVTLRNNTWQDCGYAVDLSATADARFNYWGHISGPYHATMNPFGQGDTITGDVPFIPWLPDTVESIGRSIPSTPELLLFTYPNPFNSDVTIEYALARDQEITLTVFDILGRQVITLLNQHESVGVHQAKWTADNAASGIYFAKLTTSAGSTQVVKLLLLK